MQGIDPHALALVATAINPAHEDAGAAEQARDQQEARELLQLARRQGKRRRQFEAELRDELAAVVAAGVHRATTRAAA